MDAYQNKDTGKQPMLPPPPVSADGKLEISGEGYMEYSTKVLDVLYKAEDNMTPEMAMRPAPHSVATQLGLGVQKRKEHKNKGVRNVSSDSMPVLPPIVSVPGVSSAQLATAYGQFDGQQQQQQQQLQQAATHAHMPPPPLSSTTAASSESTIGDTSQLANISRLPLSDLLRLGEGGTSGAVTTQIMELVKQSQSEVMQTEDPRKVDGTAQNKESSATTNSGPMESGTSLQGSAPQGQQPKSAKRSHDKISGGPKDKNEANDVAEMLLQLSGSDKKSGGVVEI